MRRVIVTLLICVFALGMNAQDMTSVFTAMPDQYIPQLEHAWRKDLVDLYTSGKESRLKNTMNGFSTLQKLTNDYLLLQTTERSTVEMKLLPLVNNTYVVCMISTVNGPVPDSRIEFFTTNWEPLATSDLFTQPTSDWYIKQGIDKKEIGREEFLKHAWAWKEEYGNRIVSQLKKMGSSADWDRERFTMDEGCSKAVKEVFVRLYEKGYIYKGSRIINWCPVCKTSISDAEVIHEEQDGFFWHINYPVVGEPGRFVEIATTRPETLLGDTAVAVNPDDERYTDIVGKMLELPLTDRQIPVIADPYVDKEFGTGCVKITPAHDPNDFEVGKRHNLEEINILNDDATINELGGKYAGMDRYEARKQMVADLDALGLLVKVVPHSHNVGTHDRCKTTVEPMIKPQWFVRMKEMGQAALDIIKTDELSFVPEQFDKTYIHWLENIRDWCISRQLWWGHRIPAYYCDECGEFVVAKEAPEKCPHCGCTHFTQDEDTLDTWFSSALWPFSTLGWPEKTEDLDYFYPTDVLVTGYDIIFFCFHFGNWNFILWLMSVM